MSFLNEENVNICSVEISDGRHNGYVDVCLTGNIMLRREAQEILNQLPVEGVNEVIVRSGEPVVRVVATPGRNGPMNYKELKKVGNAFMRALISWSAELTSLELNHFTTCTRRTPTTTVYAVHSELRR